MATGMRSAQQNTYSSILLLNTNICIEKLVLLYFWLVLYHAYV